MTEYRPIRTGGSLLERAAEVYDFGAAFNGAMSPSATPQPQLQPQPFAPSVEPITNSLPVDEEAPRIALTVALAGGAVAIDPARLAELGMLIPGAPIGALAEEFRLIKRQLLNSARAIAAEAGDRARTILVCSANPNEGKTYCAINLALSLAAERDTQVLLVDADFAKPDVLKRLGLTERPGLLDVLANPALNIADHVVTTDVPQLSLLPAGTKSHQDTELLASARTRLLLDQLIAADPRRIIIFDSPPALAASPAATLAHHVGQVMMVVRADRTSDGDLREAVSLLSGCNHIQLVLNATSFAPGGRRFGSYYEQESLT
jgi:exopolysaccharide/PEP-CTERM locus tyrosine autokinase